MHHLMTWNDRTVFILFLKSCRPTAKKIEPLVPLLYSITLHWNQEEYLEVAKKLNTLPKAGKVAYTEPYEY